MSTWKPIVLCVSLMLFTGCASQIMKSYIGKDVREAILDYGAPANALDMGDGRRAFQWVINSSYKTPTTANTTGSASTIGSTTWVNSNTTITGGQTINSSCLYTLFGRWNEESNSWIIVDFKKPKLMCE